MFTKSFLTVAAACSLLVSSVNAHILITEPIPYGEDSLNNSPLEPDGSDFPCKQRPGVYDIGIVNEIPVGVPQRLAFKGGATHGGGSCQLSVSLDKNPDKTSEWKVIHTILGGCPNSAAANANGSAAYPDNPTFQYSMPRGMPNGEYTLAWTWFNKLGNREMYMNCAPIKVSGGADNNEVYDTLPEMFVANIGNGCATKEGEDFVFPQCGLNVETVMQTALGSSTSGICAAATGGAGSGPGSGGSSSAQPTGYSAPASSPAAPTGYGLGASSAAAPAVPSYGSGSSSPGYGSSQAAVPTAPSYGDALLASGKAPAPTGYWGVASGVEHGGAAGGIATAHDIVTETAVVSITADGPAPSGYAPPAKPASPGKGSSGGRPPSYGNKKVKDQPSSSNATAADSTRASGCSGRSVACSKQDEVICLDDGQWGLCDNGCVVPRQLAAGTSCTGGVISKRHSMAGHVRRHLRPHSHKL